MSDLPFKLPIVPIVTRQGTEHIDASDRRVSVGEMTNFLNDRLPLLLSIAEAAEKLQVVQGEKCPAEEVHYDIWYQRWAERLWEAESALDTALSAWREGKGKV